jgi:hypothetical protein
MALMPKRLTFAGRLAFAAAAFCAVGAWPAGAQFGSIFNDSPRPPADVPGGSDASDAMPSGRTLPERPPLQGVPQRIGPGRPPSQAIQSAPLAPPPGATATPETSRDNAASPTPGLPAGIRQPPGTPQPANTAPQPGDEIVSEPPTAKIENQRAVFSGLDKITGRIISFDVEIGETVQFGALRVVPRVCYTRPPTETPNTDAFIEVSEVTLQGEIRRIFSGWMFAASPGLHAVEHPIYDVWLTDCKQPLTKVAEEPQPAAQPAAPQRGAPQTGSSPSAAPPAQRVPRPAPPSSLERAFPAPIR